MKCCEQEMTTPFCPHCGKESKSSKMTLLTYLKSQREGYLKRVTILKKHGTTDGAKRRLARLSEHLERRNQWIRFVSNSPNEF